MNYNKIIIPLRILALFIELIIIILLICSFNHPFDMHIHIENAMKDVEEKRHQDEYDRYFNEIKIELEKNLPHYDLNIDHSGTYEYNYDNYGTYEDR